MRLTPVAERLVRLSIPEPNSGCLLWLGSIDGDGYGRVGVGRRSKRAHVVSYELENGPIPDGLEPDHKCRTRSCIEPTHLEPVTHKTNVQRGLLAGPRKLVCDKCGSPYEVLQNARGRNPIRGCRSCANGRRRERRKCCQ